MNEVKATISLLGKQYLVSKGDKIVSDRVVGEVGSEIDSSDVLLIVDGEDVKVGEPKVEGAKVVLKIVEHTKAEKVVVSRFKAKSRYRKSNGHKQPISKLEVVSIQI